MINKGYLSTEIVEKLSQEFYKNNALPSVTLMEFFERKEFDRMISEISAINFKVCRRRMEFSYKKSVLPESIKKVISNEFLKAYISSIIGKKIKKIEGEIRVFGWKDYTLINDKTIEKPSVELIIDFSVKMRNDCGGGIIYVDGTGEYSEILSSHNSITLLNRKKGIQKFVKYVNHLAGKDNKIYFIGRIII